jgi:hypothetical protein
MVEALDTYPALSERFRQMMRRFRDFLANTVHIGQRKGLFRDDLDPGLAAQSFVSGLIGSEIQYYQDPKAIALRESMHAATEQFVTWLGGGRLRRPSKASRNEAAQE